MVTIFSLRSGNEKHWLEQCLKRSVKNANKGAGGAPFGHNARACRMKCGLISPYRKESARSHTELLFRRVRGIDKTFHRGNVVCSLIIKRARNVHPLKVCNTRIARQQKYPSGLGQFGPRSQHLQSADFAGRVSFRFARKSTIVNLANLSPPEIETPQSALQIDRTRFIKSDINLNKLVKCCKACNVLIQYLNDFNDISYVIK